MKIKIKNKTITVEHDGATGQTTLGRWDSEDAAADLAQLGLDNAQWKLLASTVASTRAAWLEALWFVVNAEYARLDDGEEPDLEAVRRAMCGPGGLT